MVFKFRAFYPQLTTPPTSIPFSAVCSFTGYPCVYSCICLLSSVHHRGQFKFPMTQRLPDPSGIVMHIPMPACIQHTLISLSNHTSYSVIDLNTKLIFPRFHFRNNI